MFRSEQRIVSECRRVAESVELSGRREHRERGKFHHLVVVVVRTKVVTICGRHTRSDFLTDLVYGGLNPPKIPIECGVL